MDEDAVPLLSRAASPVQWLRMTSKRSTLRRMLTSPVFYALVLLAAVLSILMRHTSTIQALSVAYARPRPRPVPHFIAYGNSQCLPPVTESLIERSLRKHATCRKFAPFTTGGPRIATVTAHFGKEVGAYRPAFQTHLLHSLIHGTEVRVMCDAVVDDLWNKPAFILNLLLEEMLKPVHERLEWIMWVDRDTMILDQCRPMTSFLPPKRSVTKSWWLHARGKPVEKATSRHSNATEVNLLVTSDFNGLNNGVFLLRVNEWAVSLFTDILAFRYYRPDVELPFTEQTAMAHVIETDPFRDQTKYVPQHWFNAYTEGRARDFQDRKVIGPEIADASARKGDFLVHFAGVLGREQVIEEYAEMLEALGDVWEEKTVQRDSSEDILKFWDDLGYAG